MIVEQITRNLPPSGQEMVIAERLRSALLDPNRPAKPALPSATIDEQALAAMLEQVACRGDASPYAAVGLARRFTSKLRVRGGVYQHISFRVSEMPDPRFHLLVRLLAEALLHRCPNAQDLLAPYRADLERLARRVDPSQTGGGGGR